MDHGSSCLLVYQNARLLALLQDNVLAWFIVFFLRKLFGCVRDITAFILADTDISMKPKY